MKRRAIHYERPLADPAAAATSGETNAATRDRLSIVEAVSDGAGPPGPALTAAFERLAAGDAEVLLTSRLRAVAGSLRELVALLDWLAVAHADLVALDVGLDTGSRAGQALVAVLQEVEGWDRAPESGRLPRGRPGLLGHRPELAERIIALRESGLSLQGIADALNADGEPTPRGGVTWRPSSVQVALGYRRPSPPVSSAPRPPRPPGIKGAPGPPMHPPRGGKPRGPAHD